MLGRHHLSLGTMKAAALVAMVYAGAPVALQAATVVFQEDFSGATGGLYGSGAIAGTKFAVTSGSIDIVNPTNYTCVANLTGACLDLIGNTGSGEIKSTVGIDLIAGNSYSIDFTDILQGFGPTSNAYVNYTISLGSYTVGSKSTPTITPMSFSFTAMATEISAVLGFKSTSYWDSVHGPVISDIKVTETLGVSQVPLPAALPLLIVGLGGLGLFGRRGLRQDRTAA